MTWPQIDEELRNAAQYWVASVRPDNRPYVVPRDGIWIDNTWYYGGSDATVHNRNLQSNPMLAMHIGDGVKAIIVEGEASSGRPSLDLANHLAGEHNRKYRDYGMKATPEQYAGMEI